MRVIKRNLMKIEENLGFGADVPNVSRSKRIRGDYKFDGFLKCRYNERVTQKTKIFHFQHGKKKFIEVI